MTLEEEFKAKFGQFATAIEEPPSAVLDWWLDKFRDFAQSVRLEKKDDRPEITVWIDKNRDFVEGYNQAKEDLDKKIEEELTKRGI